MRIAQLQQLSWARDSTIVTVAVVLDILVGIPTLECTPDRAHIGFDIDGVPFGRGLSQVDVQIGKGDGLSEDEFDEL